MSIVDDLQKLAALKEKGFLTQEEFDTQKKALLSGSNRKPLAGKHVRHPSDRPSKRAKKANPEKSQKKPKWYPSREITHEMRLRYDKAMQEAHEEAVREANKPKITFRNVVDTAALALIGSFAADKIKKSLKG